MKKTILLFITICVSQLCFSQTISIDSAAKYEGKIVTICEKVQGTKVSNGEKKNTYINLGAPYPDNTFTIVIFEKDAANFNYVPSEFLKNKKICVTGVIEIYKGKPQIVAIKEEQIKVE